MKRLLNTLYVTTQGAYLSRVGETVTVRNDGDVKLRLPIHTLSGIVCFGQVTCSPPLMALCAERSVAITYLSVHGRFLARVQGPVSGNVLLRRQQYRTSDSPELASAIARNIVASKINNCRTVLMRSLREHPETAGTAGIADAHSHMAALLPRLNDEQSIDSIRGIEGEAARRYFHVFNHLITRNKEAFCFSERSRRPPLDNVNALLSFLYALLAHDARAALEAVGLDPAVGYLHTDRPGRPGLALDIMEEFRPLLADRIALTLINRSQVTPQGFARSESGAVAMDEATRKTVVTTYQERKQEELQHPFLSEKMAIGLLPHAQALLLARHLRGDLDQYPPFVWR